MNYIYSGDAVASQSLSAGDCESSEESEDPNSELNGVFEASDLQRSSDFMRSAGSCGNSDVPEGAWACEGALWTEWQHCGDLRAVADTTVAAIASKALRDVVDK